MGKGLRKHIIMEDPTPYRVTPRAMKLESHKHIDTFNYEGGISIHFVNQKFGHTEFPMRNKYSRDDWRILAAIEAEITRLEQQFLTEACRP